MKLNIQMFASGTINGSSTASNCDCRIVWSSTGDTSTNSSSVTTTIQIYRSGSSSTTGTFSGSITIDGNKKNISKKFTPYNWGSWATVGSYTVNNIQHKPDGTKSIQIKGTLTNTGTSMAGTYTANGNVTLDTLHKAPTINSYSITETNALLVSAGITNNVFVKDLSQKTININYTLYDSATLQNASTYNAGSVYLNNTLPIAIDFTTNEMKTYNNEVPIIVRVLDSNDSGTYYSNLIGNFSSGGIENADKYTYIDYYKPTITASVKRDGQTSGKVVLNSNGTFFQGIIGNIKQGEVYELTSDVTFQANKQYYEGTGRINLTAGVDYNVGDLIANYPSDVYEFNYYNPITIKYKYWEYGTTEPSTYSNTISSGITISNNTFTISNLNIGNNYNYQKAYRIKVQVTDNFTSIESPELGIAVGEATWTEYADRVDFKKLTIKGNEVKVGWTLGGTLTGSSSESVPSGATELYFLIKAENNTNVSFPIYVPVIPTSTIRMNSGYYMNSSYQCRVSVDVSTSSFAMSYVYVNASNKLSTSKMDWYYR